MNRARLVLTKLCKGFQNEDRTPEQRRQKISEINLKDEVPYGVAVNEGSSTRSSRCSLPTEGPEPHAPRPRVLSSGGRSKPWKQKGHRPGKGRVHKKPALAARRHGLRAKAEDYSYDVPKKVKKEALKSP